VDYPILSDPGGEVARSFGALMPVLGVARRWTFYIGVDGRLLAVDRDVNPNTAGAEIAARLAELNVARVSGKDATR